MFVEYFYLFPCRNHCVSEKIPLGPNGTRPHFCQWFLSWNHKLLRILTYVSIIRDKRHLKLSLVLENCYMKLMHIFLELYNNILYLLIGSENVSYEIYKCSIKVNNPLNIIGELYTLSDYGALTISYFMMWPLKQKRTIHKRCYWVLDKCLHLKP